MSDPAAESSRPSWTRGLSHPNLPSISGLRAALLGYLGEVETALQDKLGGEVDLASLGMDVPSAEMSSPSSTSGEDDQPHAGASYSSGNNSGRPPDGLRRRNGPLASGTDEGHISVLQHLSTLREDVTKYLPQRLSVPAPPTLGPRGEWLRNLPHRLRDVDLSFKGNAQLHLGEYGSVVNARRRVIELVHALLPSEEWAGWERLGWEEQERDAAPRRRSLDLGRLNEADDEEEEPEYLFPNRTPASAKSMATRRRAVRSKSLGAVNFPTILNEMPRLVRVQTDPGGMSKGVLLDSDDEDDGDDAEQILDFTEDIPEETAGVKLARIVSHELGPSVKEALARSQDGKVLLEYEDLPFVWRNNEHIITGYRFIPLHASTGPIPLIKSAFNWHNETVNIHSHFIPTILIMLFIPTIIYSSPLPGAHPLDTITLVVYFLAAVLCLISSAGWHVMSGCASRKWFEWGACVDYIGISWLIAASFFTVLYNAFYCQPKIVLLYSTVNLVCGILGSFLPFQKWFNERKYKNARISFFLFLCFAMFAPMFQMYYQHGWHRGNAFVVPFVPSICTYVAGLVFYAFHFPECVWPGQFDYWCASHHVWHVSIVGAIILHYRAIFVAHSARYAFSCAMKDAGEPVGVLVERLCWKALHSLGL